MVKLTDDELVHEIAKQVQAYGGRTFYVGGCVRDELLGKEPKDLDIEVHGIEPNQLKDILSMFGTLRTQGASFGVYNVAGYDIDIAQPRTEKCIGDKHTDFEVDVNPYLGVELAAKRRDLTINSMMKDVMTGQIEDPYNGLEDLRLGIIRHVNDETFREDPLRVFRAAQFAARFEYEIALETKDLMRTMDLSELSSERVYGEMKKALMKSDKPSIFFESLRDIDKLGGWFEELIPMIGCEQSAKWHPEGDVWNHTMATLDEAAKFRSDAVNPEFYMVAALCHDMGKPKAWSRDENGYPHTYSHEVIGLPIASDFLSRINHDKSLGKYVCNMMELHMMPHNCFESNSNTVRTNHMFDKSLCPDDLVLLATADTASRGSDEIANAKAERFYLDKQLAKYEQRLEMPEVKGADLLKMGLKPGPLFKEILDNAHSCHLSGRDKESVLHDILVEQSKINPNVADYKRQLEEEKAKSVISGDDLIKLGLKPSSEFKELLVTLNKGFDFGKSKGEILDEFMTNRRVAALGTEDIKDNVNMDDYSK